LTDAVDVDEMGVVTNIAVNLGGVSRGALGVFLEGQGSPTEQCALLVYLLRQAGVPAVYCFPPRNEMKLIDAHLSRLLRIQVHGAVNDNGDVYTTNKLISVNYPWVAAYTGTNWVHLFPWLKDTEVIEGFNLYDYMPARYNNVFKWARDYALGDANILSLATDDDTPLAIWPKFIQSVLATNAPGLSLDDIGMRWVDRPKGYARWTDFPRPFVVPATNVSLENLCSESITNVFYGLTNIFDTVCVEASSVTNPVRKVTSGEVRMADLHNRRLLIRHETNGPNAHNLILNLAAYRPNAVGATNFTTGDALLNVQQASVALDASDEQINVQWVCRRHRALPDSIATNSQALWASYLGVTCTKTITRQMVIHKGDLAAVCMNVGRVTKPMLEVHAQELWNMERSLALDTNATVDANLFQGGTAFLMGMAYFENLSRFEELCRRLLKCGGYPHCDAGLAKLGAKHINGQLPNGGTITLNQPGVDMALENVGGIINPSVHADSGTMRQLAYFDYFALTTVHSSAEEHQIINRFFGQSNAVSTVKLLHRAQARLGGATAGPILLTPDNYQAQGNQNYNGLALKNHDPGMWSAVVNILTNGPSYLDLNRFAWITPGSLTNSTGSYKGMGGLVFSLDKIAALISPNNMNGGFGDTIPDNSFIPDNAGNFNLAVAPNGDYSVTTTDVGVNNKIVAPDAVASFNMQEFLDNAQNNYLVTTPVSDMITRQMALSDMITLNPSETVCQQYGQAVEAQDDSGWAGALSFVGKAWDKIADPVSAVTGEFYHDATDLTLPGPMPISLRRNYSSHNLANNQFGYSWKMNYLPFLSVSDDSTLIYAAEMDGSVLAYEQQGGTNVWLVTPAHNPLLDNLSTSGAGSTANRFRNRIVKTTGASNDTYALFGSDGSVRTYQTAPYSGFSAIKPYLMQWRDNRGNRLTFEYGTDSTQPDYREVRRILGSNGSILGLRYDVYGRIIEAYTVDGRTVKYDYDQFGDLTTVTLPDDNTIQFEYDHRTLMVTNGAAITRAMYSTHLITREIKPDGRVLLNQYDDQRRVTNQWATVGPDLRLVSNARFAFTNNFSQTNSPTNGITGSTTIYDVNNSPTVYRYASGQITNIVDAANIANSQIWWQASETNQPGCYPRSLKRMIDRRGLITDFLYDNNGNVTNTTVRGDLTGAGNTNEMAVTSTTYNTNSLPLESIDPVGNKTRTVYDAVFQWQPAQVTRLAGATPVSSNVFVWYSVTNSLAGGGTAYAAGLLQKEIRACGTPDAATNQWTHDGRGFVSQSTRRTGTTDPDVVLALTHNGRGELIVQTDADGRTIEFTYDGLGRRQSREVYENGSRVAWDFTYYNGNGEPTWSDGPRYNPEDYVWRDYDGAGRVTQEIRWRSQAKADGTGVEAVPGYELYATTFQDWDAYNNLKRVTDPRGCVTTNVWDAIGRLIEQRRLKTGGTVLASEGFAYEPGGSVAFQTNALKSVTAKRYTSNGLLKFQSNPDGSTNTWQYYLDGRARYEYLPNGSFWETVYDDANRRVTNFFKSGASVLAVRSSEFDRRGNLIRRVDEGGNAFTNVFDGLDRVKMTAGPVITNPTNGAPNPGNSTPVQQITRYTYDASGRVLTVANAAGEKTITTSDALGRVVKVEVRDAGNALVSVTTTGYTPDHHGLTVTNGTGASAITSTSFTDTYGSPVLDIGQPASGTREFTLHTYDVGGNRVETARMAATNSTVVELWHTGAAYDELNRVTNRWDRDDALTRLAYDAAGNVTNRTLPGSLQWIGRYSAAGQLLLEYNVASGLYARSNMYFYNTNGPLAGLLASHIDGRGVTNTLAYDAWMRPVTNTFAGSLSEQKMTLTWNYDVRGLTTNISQSFTSSSNGPAVNVRRGFNAYGQLTSESIQLGGTNQSSASVGWNSSGRRTSLALNPPLSAFNNSFGYRADGLLASVSGDAGNADYTYDNGGLLVSRTVGARVTSISGRDGIGRPLGITTTVNGQTALSETLGWTGDGLLSSQQLQRGDFTDQRSYSYADLTRRLTSEQLKLDATRGWTNSLTYDRGTSGGLGVLTKMSQGSALAWATTPDALGRVQRETNSLARRNARGRINGVADVTATVDGKPLPVSVNGTNWSALMEVTAGAHKLETIAHHPSGQWNTNHAHWFTNRIGTLATTNIYDAAGNLTQRVWRRSNGLTNIVQTLTWDGMGRLATFTERTTNRNGFNWSAVYDPSGRRLRTVTASVTNNIVISNQVTTINQYYDPSVEFLEVGFSVNNAATWKLYGPDGDGGYGSMQGVGGLEAVNENGTQRTLVSDSRGNVLAGFADLQPAQINWNESRPTAYGYVPGCRPPTLGAGVSYAEAASWRGRVIDITGLSCLGLRHYEPGSGRFLSYDSAWNVGDPNGYSFCGGDPVNRFDPTGRWGKGVLNWATGIDANGSLPLADQIRAYREGGEEWMQPMVTQPAAKTVDFTWNLGLCLFATPQSENMSVDQRQALAQMMIDKYGSPLQPVFGVTDRDPLVENMPANVAPILGDLAMMGTSQRGGYAPNYQARRGNGGGAQIPTQLEFNFTEPFSGPYENIQNPKNVGPGQDFTAAQKRAFYEANMLLNNGQLIDDYTGDVLSFSQKSQKGIAPSPNEAQVDHYFPKSEGGLNSSANARITSRVNNLRVPFSLDAVNPAGRYF
jgi:RHS repeat-associated protein